MPLPKEGTPEWEDLKSKYPISDIAWRNQTAEALGFGPRNSFTTAMNRRKVYLSPTPTQAIPDINDLPKVIMPKIKLLTHRAKQKKGDEETQALHLTDLHICEITPTYDSEIARSRLNEIFSNLMTITTLHRKMYPINNLKILMTGDNVHGENPYQGGKLEGVECGAHTQVVKHAFPMLSSFLMSCKQEFSNVEVECVYGNHGKYSKEAPETSNWDLMLYYLLQTNLEQYKIKVNVSNTWYKMVDIQGYKFFLAHFDQIRMSNGIPYFALIRKIQSWQIHFGGFDYAVGGHFHKEDFLRVNARCKVIMGSSLATDDLWALKVIGTSSIPVMWTFGVHNRHGITWMYSLNADPKFTPDLNIEQAENVQAGQMESR